MPEVGSSETIEENKTKNNKPKPKVEIVEELPLPLLPPYHPTTQVSKDLAFKSCLYLHFNFPYTLGQVNILHNVY